MNVRKERWLGAYVGPGWLEYGSRSVASYSWSQATQNMRDAEKLSRCREIYIDTEIICLSLSIWWNPGMWGTSQTNPTPVRLKTAKSCRCVAHSVVWSWSSFRRNDISIVTVCQTVSGHLGSIGLLVNGNLRIRPPHQFQVLICKVSISSIEQL